MNEHLCLIATIRKLALQEGREQKLLTISASTSEPKTERPVEIRSRITPGLTFPEYGQAILEFAERKISESRTFQTAH